MTNTNTVSRESLGKRNCTLALEEQQQEAGQAETPRQSNTMHLLADGSETPHMPSYRWNRGWHLLKGLDLPSPNNPLHGDCLSGFAPLAFASPGTNKQASKWVSEHQGVSTYASGPTWCTSLGHHSSSQDGNSRDVRPRHCTYRHPACPAGLYHRLRPTTC